MYFDRERHIGVWIACIILVLALVITGSVIYQQRAEAELRSEAEYAIRETIQRMALQCFAVEGVYPESLDYLVDNYGLRVNTDDYFVVYEIFAENMPPNIRVARKEG